MDRGVRDVGQDDDAADRLLGQVTGAVDTAGPPEERVQAGVEALLLWCAEEPGLARECFVESLEAGPDARDRRSRTLRLLAETFEQPLRELRPSPRIAQRSAQALVGSINELIFESVARREVADLPDLAGVISATWKPPVTRS